MTYKRRLTIKLHRRRNLIIAVNLYNLQPTWHCNSTSMCGFTLSTLSDCKHDPNSIYFIFSCMLSSNKSSWPSVYVFNCCNMLSYIKDRLIEWAISLDITSKTVPRCNFKTSYISKNIQCQIVGKRSPLWPNMHQTKNSV